MYLATD